MTHAVERKSDMLAVFFCSLAVLLFEMAQIRGFSYSLPSVLSYISISLAMTGFGIGAMLLSMVPSLGRQNPRRALAILALLQAVSMIISTAIFCRVSWDCILGIQEGLLPLIIKILLPCMLPYFFAGLFFAIVFASAVQNIGKVYFWNLFGSGVGAILITLLVTPLGAEGVMWLAVAISLAVTFMLAVPGNRMLAGVACILLLACAISFPYRHLALPFQPDPRDATGFYQLRALQEKGLGGNFINEYNEWNIVAKIDVWQQGGEKLRVAEETDYRLVTVDSGAATVIIGDPGKETWGNELFGETIYGLAYHAKPAPEDVLVIGTGGGTDVQAALHWGAQDVTAVEINSSTIKMITGPYAEFTKWPLSPRVSLVHEDGRSFIKNTRKKFDVIQMSGVDTLTVNATGAFNMVEEYLYTVEAFTDYLQAMKPDGVLCVIRFLAADLRLTALAGEALMRLGIDDPSGHVATFSQGLTTALIVSKSRLSAEQIARLSAISDRETPNNVHIPPYEVFDFRLNAPVETLYLPQRLVPDKYTSYFESIISGDEGRTIQFKKMGITTDDRPYFMFLGFLVTGLVDKAKNNFELFKLFWLATIIIAIVCIVVPVLIFQRKIPTGKTFAWLLPYFSIIGACFMMLEIGIINKFSIFMGSPGASMAVVLTSILISSGIGSFTTGLLAWQPEKKILLATIMVTVATLLIMFFSTAVFEACWEAGLGYVTRGIIAGILIVPLGFAMGWFFPSGLKAIDMYLSESHLLPWAISINGFMSVVGSIAVLPITFFTGFSVLLYISLSGYIVAGILSLTILKK